MSSYSPSRRGLTLLELLVVIFVISILLAIAIPVFRPPVQKRAIREAARSVSASLGMARTRAQQTGRPWGIMFQSLTGSPEACLTLHFVEVPPPYAGDSVSSRMRITNMVAAGTNSDGDSMATWTLSFPESDSWTTFVRVGDTLKLNYQGHTYRVEAISAGSSTITFSSRTVVRWPLTSQQGEPGYAFQFFRKPQKSSQTPLQLPNSAVVDLLVSGIGDGRFNPSISNPVIVTFAPTGTPDLIYHADAPGGEKLFDSAHFLISKPGTYGAENLADMDSLWVSLGYQNGLITTTENGYVGSGAPDPNVAADVRAARTYARSGQNMGG